MIFALAIVKYFEQLTHV